jgi:uncharacterized protein (TIRG00374 family)
MSEPTDLHVDRPSRATARLRNAVAWTIAAACLIWVFHDLHRGTFLDQVGHINWGWIAAAIALDIGSYWAQGVRWGLLLRPLGRISSLRTTQAVYMGLFTNEIVPLRVGEIVRTYTVSRWLGAPIMRVVPSLLVERFFDGVWLAAGVALTALLVPLPPKLMGAADILGIVVLAAVALFVAVILRSGRGAARGLVVKKPRGKIAAGLYSLTTGIIGGIRQIGVSRHFWGALAVSALILVCQIYSFWFVILAYGIKIGLWAGAAVLLIEHLGTLVPNAPSNLGTYQFFTVVGLSLFGIDKTTASGFSMVVFVVLTLPLWAMGFWAVAASGMSLKQIRADIETIARHKEPVL